VIDYCLLHIGSFWKADTEPGQQPQSLGSIAILNAESIEIALQTLKEDMYYKNNVWDWDKVCKDLPKHTSYCTNTIIS
jgi:hypothetical protein